MESNEFIEEEILDEWSDTHPGIKRELKKKGYKYLGAGVDQTAYLEPGTGLVLKIFGTQLMTSGSDGNQLSEDQKMFIIFAKFCITKKDNPFLPKFSGFERFVFEDQTYFQIRQERLKKVPRKLGRMLEDLADDIARSYQDANEFITNEKAQAASDDYYADSQDNIYYALISKFGEQETHRLIKTIFALNKIASQKGYTFDLHAGNYMMRGNTPVITDPWVHPDGKHNGRSWLGI